MHEIIEITVDGRSNFNIDHNVEETEDMRVYRMILITG